MVADVVTILWKESRELTTRQGRSWWSRPNLGFIGTLALLFGILYPTVLGPLWLERPYVLAVAVLLPLLLVGRVSADAVAGERERRTLETLLATGFSQSAFLIGKLFFAIGYGWVFTLGILLVGAPAVDLLRLHALAFYRPSVVWGALALSVLTAVMTGEIGVLVSLRAQRVAEAANTAVVATMVVLGLGPVIGVVVALEHQFGAALLLGALAGDGRLSLTRVGAEVDGRSLEAAIVGALALLDLALGLWAVQRFRCVRLLEE